MTIDWRGAYNFGSPEPMLNNPKSDPWVMSPNPPLDVGVDAKIGNIRKMQKEYDQRHQKSPDGD